MPKIIPPALKDEAIRLRQEERLSVDEIKARTGLSVGTLSALLCVGHLDCTCKPQFAEAWHLLGI